MADPGAMGALFERLVEVMQENTQAQRESNQLLQELMQVQASLPERVASAVLAAHAAPSLADAAAGPHGGATHAGHPMAQPMNGGAPGWHGAAWLALGAAPQHQAPGAVLMTAPRRGSTGAAGGSSSGTPGQDPAGAAAAGAAAAGVAASGQPISEPAAAPCGSKHPEPPALLVLPAQALSGSSQELEEEWEEEALDAECLEPTVMTRDGGTQLLCPDPLGSAYHRRQEHLPPAGYKEGDADSGSPPIQRRRLRKKPRSESAPGGSDAAGAAPAPTVVLVAPTEVVAPGGSGSSGVSSAQSPMQEGEQSDDGTAAAVSGEAAGAQAELQPAKPGELHWQYVATCELHGLGAWQLSVCGCGQSACGPGCRGVLLCG